jgi:hypothetical protein
MPALDSRALHWCSARLGWYFAPVGGQIWWSKARFMAVDAE